ncbi:hypothetical protein AN639_11490 [Candidatus Epulonipiscium fishelsonii]|uniref:Uncharacterized protein n=1 Tax=Candidatus Epulonipiscium fishelsonii TaxID=77094 RepID=A0ACC8X865_9FIRM|nr:hypothetical protein AN396_11520 [Epulopiscium sp. SCG-B11WGA-EpuloA1]ONI43071.1 hypothetical protein AN639_11490 [Epulopiscium sp. SCG-B05WGA-EpuloA1]
MAFGKKKKGKDAVEEVMPIPSPVGDGEIGEEEVVMAMALPPPPPAPTIDPKQEEKLNRINGLRGLGTDFNGRQLNSLDEEELKDFILSNILKSIYAGDYYKISMYGREKSTLVEVCLKDEHLGFDIDGIFTKSGKILLKNLRDGKEISALNDTEIATYPVREIKNVVEEFIINQNGLVEIYYRINKYSLEKLTSEVLKLVDLCVGVSKIKCKIEEKEVQIPVDVQPETPIAEEAQPEGEAAQPESEEVASIPEPPIVRSEVISVVENICISLGKKMDGTQVVLKLINFNEQYLEMDREFKTNKKHVI